MDFINDDKWNFTTYTQYKLESYNNNDENLVSQGLRIRLVKDCKDICGRAASSS